MGSAARTRLGHASTQALSYALAVLLPVTGALITSRVAALHALPMAPHFIAMAAVATLGGFGPAFCSILVTVFTQYFLFPLSSHNPDPRLEAMRVCVLLTTALVIGLMTRRRRRISEALEAALTALQEQSAALVESQQASKCVSWTYDSRDIMRWVPGGYEVFGRPFTEVESLSSPIELIYPEDQPVVREAIAKMVSARSSLRIEYRTEWPNGELHWSEARGNPVPGNPFLWRGLTFDITERKMAEAALIRSEKLAAMGRLASTVAHEINNPLEAVTNLLYLARNARSLDPETQSYLATAEKELARLGNITRLTLGFVRSSAVHSNVDVVEIVEDVLSIFHHRLEMKNVAVERRYEEGVLIDMAPHELRQILVNLIANAADAVTPPDGRVWIDVEYREGSAVIEIADNGSGISKKHIDRIFDPFFSTKDDVGTGIGLWVTRELVEKNRGLISVRSGGLADGVSTSFRVELPAAPRPSRQAVEQPIEVPAVS